MSYACLAETKETQVPTSLSRARSLDSETTAWDPALPPAAASPSSSSPCAADTPSDSCATCSCVRHSGHFSLTANSAVMHSLQRNTRSAIRLPFCQSRTSHKSGNICKVIMASVAAYGDAWVAAFGARKDWCMFQQEAIAHRQNQCRQGVRQGRSIS